MPKMLDKGIQKQVQDVFTELDHLVEVILFKQRENCSYCEETAQLLQEVVDLSDKLHLSMYDLEENADLAARYSVDKSPEFVIAGKDEDDLIDYGIRFSGIPAGHEFTSLINSLLVVSKRETSLNQQTKTFLAGLTQPVLLQVFVTPT